MDPATLQSLLAAVAAGDVSVEEASRRLEDLPFAEVFVGGEDAARIDHHRELRTGQPEVVFCQGKSPQQVKAIAREVLEHGDVLLGTRASAAHYQAVAQSVDDARYFEDAQVLLVDRRKDRPCVGHIIVATGGTADYRVADEAAICAEVMGNRVTRLYDVGVAGVHRVLAHREQLGSARVVIAVAGMEGALPTIIAGLVKVPVIAVPTSVGYGAHFGGVAPLLTMLNSCAPGIGTVNIDNGFGAAALASRINRVARPDGDEGPGEARCSAEGRGRGEGHGRHHHRGEGDHHGHGEGHGAHQRHERDGEAPVPTGPAVASEERHDSPEGTGRTSVPEGVFPPESPSALEDTGA